MTATPHSRFCLLLIFLTLIVNPAHASRCSDAIPLAPGETWRDPGHAAGDHACFVVEIAEAGFLVLDLRVAPTARRARLFLPVTETDAARELLLHSATFAALDVLPGSHFVQVGSEDPLEPLEPFRLQARFATQETWMKGELDSELEVEPDPLTTGPRPPAAGDLYDLSSLPGLLRSHTSALCRPGEGEDPAGGFACATPLALGSGVRSELGNAWGDDVDLFRLDIDQLITVEIVARGEPELAGELYDRFGQRLEVAATSRNGLRLLRTLTPGAYFFRLAGQSFLPNPYSLQFSAAIGP